MTWRDVFDTKLAGIDIDDAAKMAFRARYKFFAHNGRIYFINKDGDYYDTELTVEKELLNNP